MTSGRWATCVLHFGDPTVTDRCVRSVATQTAPSDLLVVVNDASAYAPPCPAEVIRTGENLGYAGGMNVAIEWARAGGFDAALLVTNDVVLGDGAAEVLFDRLQKDEHLAVVAPALHRRAPDGSLFLWALAGQVDLRAATVALSRRPGDRAEWLGGSVWMARTAALTDVGPFDARYFLYWEEVDWCLRARDRSWTLDVEVGAIAVEEASASAGSVPGLQAYYLTRNRLVFAADHAPARTMLVLWLRLGAASIWASVRRGERDGLRGWLDFTRRRLGRCARYS